MCFCCGSALEKSLNWGERTSLSQIPKLPLPGSAASYSTRFLRVSSRLEFGVRGSALARPADSAGAKTTRLRTDQAKVATRTGEHRIWIFLPFSRDGELAPGTMKIRR